MDEHEWLAKQFEAERPQLRAVAYRMLRSRESRREESLEASVPEPIVSREDGIDPEQEALLADSVGLALLVVLDTLSPAERLAFVLHDLFAVPFDEIAPIVGRSPTATRQLASSTWRSWAPLYRSVKEAKPPLASDEQDPYQDEKCQHLQSCSDS